MREMREMRQSGGLSSPQFSSSGALSTTSQDTLQGSPRMVQVKTGEAARLLVEGLAKLQLPLSKVLIDGEATVKQGLLWQLQPLGIDEGETARNIGADLQLGKRWRSFVVKGRRGLGKGSEEDEANENAQEGRGAYSKPHHQWLERWGSLGVRRS